MTSSGVHRFMFMHPTVSLLLKTRTSLVIQSSPSLLPISKQYGKTVSPVAQAKSVKCNLDFFFLSLSGPFWTICKFYQICLQNILNLTTFPQCHLHSSLQGTITLCINSLGSHLKTDFLLVLLPLLNSICYSSNILKMEIIFYHPSSKHCFPCRIRSKFHQDMFCVCFSSQVVLHLSFAHTSHLHFLCCSKLFSALLPQLCCGYCF